MSPGNFSRKYFPSRIGSTDLPAPTSAQPTHRMFVQDVLIKAWEALQAPGAIRNPEAWCMTLTRNRALDKLRKQGRQYEVVEERVDLPSTEADPLRQTVGREAAARISLLIEGLPEQQRAVMRLRDLEQYSYKEIAELLQLEVNYVKVLLHRARTRVRQQLTRVHQHGI